MLQCQRIGCDARFTEDDNPDGGCIYHAGPPVFHDGNKEWSCCKQRSHDFGLFMDIKGCTVGKHTTEKPPKPAESPNKPVELAAKPIPAGDPRAGCPRCSQGFFCQDHAAIPGTAAPPPPVPQPPPPKPPPKPAVEVGPDEEQTCKHKGCGVKFTENGNHDGACNYHPGPPVFHDRKKGWACCDKHVWSFDEFMEIPPCTTGRHDAHAE